MNKKLNWIIGFAVAGLILSIYAFLHNRGFASGAICEVNATINCDVVNKGPYSQIYGIPVALIGVIGYVLIIATAFLKKQNQKDKGLTKFLVLASVGGFLFSLYLTALEAFVLYAWCLICLSSQLLILLILLFSVSSFIHERKTI